jgi:hypothetical protein
MNEIDDQFLRMLLHLILPRRQPLRIAFMVVIGSLLLAGPALAETKKKTRSPAPATEKAAPELEARSNEPVPLSLSAVLGAGSDVIASDLVWRIFAIEPNGNAVRETMRSALPSPTLTLPQGEYVIHASYGLGSASRRIKLGPKGGSERLSLEVGGLSVRGVLNEQQIAQNDLAIAVYIPSEINSEEKLVTDKLKSGEVLRLPVGTYHLVTTYGGSNASVRADIELQAGKTVDVLMRHRAARITLKLVSKSGGEALANTAWTLLTPGGDVVKEELGAFPSMILAEGIYTVIARHDAKTYVEEVKIESGPDRDVEVIAKEK